MGLVNGALGTVVAICYESDQYPPPCLPIAVMVRFDSYTGPTLPDGTVPITPLRRSWFTTSFAAPPQVGVAQGMTLDKVVKDFEKREFSSGLTFVACSRVCYLDDFLFVPPLPFQQLAGLCNNSPPDRHGSVT